MTIIEKVARAICTLNGVDPDSFVTYDRKRAWLFYIETAHVAIEALAANVTDKMAFAAGQYRHGSVAGFEAATIRSYGGAIAAALRCAGEGE